MMAAKMSAPISSSLDDLRRIALFAGLPSEHLQLMAELLRGKTFAAGTTLMTADQPGESVYFILSGMVKVHIEQENGGDVIISILGAGDSVGEMSALDNVNRSASVGLLEQSTLLWLDRETFRRCLATMPALAYNLSCALSARLRAANEQIQSLAAFDAETRIARQIVAFAERYGQKADNGNLYIPIRLTQSDVAALVGASREHANKILVSYKERNYLSVDQSHHITVHDLQAIARRC